LKEGIKREKNSDLKVLELMNKVSEKDRDLKEKEKDLLARAQQQGFKFQDID